jgi:hypothetical protein
MTDRKPSNLPFESTDSSEQELWQLLEEIPDEKPSPNMRRSFYRQLENINNQSWLSALHRWLGLSGNNGWVTVVAVGVLGLGLGQMMQSPQVEEPTRLVALEENVALLNRELVLNRLQDPSAGMRLRGVVDAGGLVEHDPEITQALLLRATEDSVHSVRSAAIDALAPQMGSSTVSVGLMSSLENAESPLVQLALVDLVLRNGNGQQLDKLLLLVNEKRLHPDLVTHVKKSLRKEEI